MEYYTEGLIGMNFLTAQKSAGLKGFRIRALYQNGVQINKQEVFPKNKNYIFVTLDVNDKILTAKLNEKEI